MRLKIKKQYRYACQCGCGSVAESFSKRKAELEGSGEYAPIWAIFSGGVVIADALTDEYARKIVKALEVAHV